MSIKQEFVLRAIARDDNISALCRQYGISRKTAYKWLRRFRKHGMAGLVDRSKRPKSSPLTVKPEIVLEVVRLKQKHRTWGPKKLAVLLAKSGVPLEDVPSRSSMCRILYASGLVKRRRRHRITSGGLPVRPSVAVEAPNDLWTVDFKGWWRTRDGVRCDPLTVRDAFSRFVLELRIMRHTGDQHVRPVFEKLFDLYGLPKVIQSDNGPPFASRTALAGLSKLSAWWISLGIEVVRSRLGTPTDNAGHERMHADIRVEIQEHAARTWRAQQRACDDWRTEFNHVRPHEALSMKTPADIYRPSSRRRGVVVIGGYPDDCELRKVRHRGDFRMGNGWRVYATGALARLYVGVQPQVDHYKVWFYNRLIGTFRDGDDSVTPVTPVARKA
jgi:transposase InsO family protein